MSDCELR